MIVNSVSVESVAMALNAATESAAQIAAVVRFF